MPEAVDAYKQRQMMTLNCIQPLRPDGEQVTFISAVSICLQEVDDAVLQKFLNTKESIIQGIRGQ